VASPRGSRRFGLFRLKVTTPTVGGLPSFRQSWSRILTTSDASAGLVCYWYVPSTHRTSIGSNLAICGGPEGVRFRRFRLGILELGRIEPVIVRFVLF
jgi:hypothetical protein